MIPVMPPKVYDFLKALAIVWLPATGAAYVSLDLLFGFGNSEYVTGVIVVVTTFLGATVLSSNHTYKKSEAFERPLAGTVNLDPDAPVKLNLEEPLENFAGKRQVVLNIENGDKLRAASNALPEDDGTASQ